MRLMTTVQRIFRRRDHKRPRGLLITVWLEVRVLPGPPFSTFFVPFAHECSHFIHVYRWPIVGQERDTESKASRGTRGMCASTAAAAT